MEDEIKKFNLKIESSKNGTSIVGQEEDVRKAIIYLVSYKYDVTQKDYYNQHDKDARLFSIVIDGCDNELIGKVKNIIDKTQRSMGYTLENPYYINLITHILILIQRIKNGNCIENKVDFIDKVNIHYFRIANEISIEISKIIGGEKLNDSELFFIYQYLVSCGTSNDITDINIDKGITEISTEIVEFANDVVGDFKKELNCDIRGNKRIYNLLLLHLNAMIKRCKFNIIVMNPSRINLDLKAKNKDEVFKEMSEMFFDDGCINSIDDFIKDLYIREEEGMTGVGDGIAIPHGKSDSVIHTSIAIGRANHDIEWNTMDEKPVRVVIMFAVRSVDKTKHVILLSQVAQALCDEDVIEKLLTLKTKEEVINLFK